MKNLIKRYEELTDLKTYANQLLLNSQELIIEVFKQNKQNEQWFLDYLDELNKLSITY